jgi:hypothetical protein
MKQAGLKIEKRTSTRARCALAVLALFVPAFLAAANPSSLLVRVRVSGGDILPPNPVADLAAFPTPATGEVFLNWTAPSDPPLAGSVAGYEVRYATFSVADLGGNAAAWWAAAQAYAVSISTQPAGQPQGVSVAPLTEGVRHYFAVRSLDGSGNLSALDDNAVNGPQASAIPRSLRPAPVAGLLSVPQPDTSVNVNWNPVEINEDGSAADDIRDYDVRRSTSFSGPFSVLLSSGAATSGFSVPLASSQPASTEYVQILAVDDSGNTSDPALSNILEVTNAGIIGQMAVARDGTDTRSYVPASIMGELAAQNLLMRVTPNGDAALNRDPRRRGTYDVSFISPAQVVDKNFTLSRPAMSVVLQSTFPLVAGNVGVLWWNGASWIKMSVDAADVDTVLNTVSFRTALPGTYQIRSFLAPTELTLDKGSVFPRIFSPNGDGVNDEVYFVVSGAASAVEGKIYDVAGEEVADLRLAGAGAPTPDSLSWNGRDRNGDVVRAGTYIYRVKGDGKSITGTIVVAQ